ncbi:ORF130 [Spodoptera frugiperda granulovirus]|nr:ORF130 [Spodoptera frugiperda granulovirus]AJK91791.1 ORF130 [Spodoptera frugiperda granulovirus]
MSTIVPYYHRLRDIKHCAPPKRVSVFTTTMSTTPVPITAIAHQCLSADSVVYLLKSLLIKIGQLETSFMFGQDHPCITIKSLESDLATLLETFLEKKVIAKVTSEAEYQLQEWYCGKYNSATCTLPYFDCLLTQVLRHHPDNSRKLRSFLKTPLKKSMLSAFETFADLQAQESDADYVQQRNVFIFKLILRLDARLQRLPKLRKRNNAFFRFNQQFVDNK